MAYFDKYGVEFSDDRKTLIKCPDNFQGEYVIPDGVRYIGEHAFHGVSITSVIIPDSVVRIEDGAFQSCICLKAVSGAATYELVIRDKDGNVICTLVFNANGQLTTIAFNAPARNNAPQQTQSAGFSFTVTGLESGTGYDLTMTAKDTNGTTLQENTMSFITTGGEQGVEDVSANFGGSRKLLRNGQILILRGNHTYTLTGQEVR